jgi:hypothetical protein
VLGSASFEQALSHGNLGEVVVSDFLKSSGAGVIASYDYSGADNKAPRLMFKSKGLVLPDLDVCKEGTRFWLEVKTYHGPAHNRKHNTLVHGITRRLFDQYAEVSTQTGTPVFVAIVELDSGALLVADLKKLSPLWPCQCGGCKTEHGMCWVKSPGIKRGVYWARDLMVPKHMFAAAQIAHIRAAHAELTATSPPGAGAQSSTVTP